MPQPLVQFRGDDHHEGVVVAGDVTAVGVSAVGVNAALWDRELRVGRGPLFAFPHAPVRIRREGAEFIADPCGVVTYNTGSIYERRRLANHADHVTWVRIDPRVLGDMLEPYWPGAGEADEPHIPFTSTWCDAPAFRTQCAMLRARGAGPGASTMEIDERLLLALGAIIAEGAHRAGRRPMPRRSLTARRRADAAERMKEVLATRLHEPLTLDRVTREAGLSTFHGCRVFRAHTGQSLHGYLTELRLRRAAMNIAEGDAKLTRVAFDHGFSSHAHFTDTFRRWAGAPPSAWRSDPWVAWARDALALKGQQAPAGAAGPRAAPTSAAIAPSVSSAPRRVRA